MPNNSKIPTLKNPDILYRPRAPKGLQYTPLVHRKEYVVPIRDSRTKETFYVTAEWRRGMGQSTGLFVGSRGSGHYEVKDVCQTRVIVEARK
jgi:hypothetical protein